MDIKSVKTGVKMVQIAFSIDKAQEDLEMYSKLVLNRLGANNVTVDEFNSAIAHFIDTQEVNYKQLPTVSQLLKFCNKAPKSVEVMANEEMVKAFTAYTGSHCQFENPVTNYVIQYCCGGLSNFIEEYICEYKENKSSVPFRKKEFIESWIIAYDNKNYYYGELRCGRYLPTSSKPMLIESTQKLDESMLLEYKEYKEHKEAKSLNIVKDLSESLINN